MRIPFLRRDAAECTMMSFQRRWPIYTYISAVREKKSGDSSDIRKTSQSHRSIKVSAAVVPDIPFPIIATLIRKFHLLVVKSNNISSMYFFVQANLEKLFIFNIVSTLFN